MSELLGLPGTQFLGVYLLIAAGVLVLGEVLDQVLVAVPRKAPPLDDPYAIAFVRGGRDEAIRVASVSLVDRGLLVPSGGQVTAIRDAASVARRPIERAILEACRGAKPAWSLPADGAVRSACAGIEDSLARQGVINPSARTIRALIALASVGVLAFLGLAKIQVALARGRSNIGFLLALMLSATESTRRWRSW